MTTIADINDQLRKGGTMQTNGVILITSGVQAMGNDFVAQALRNLRDFNTFTEENDPSGEHDFGVLDVMEKTVMWKIDYYDPTMTYGSDDPTSIEQTKRVLTIMLSEEY